MLLNFIVREVKEGTKLDEQLLTKFGVDNAFIVVGEEVINDEKYYKVHHIDFGELQLVEGINIVDQAYTCLKSDLEDIGSCVDIAEFDIDKEYLTLDIVEDILNLNRE